MAFEGKLSSATSDFQHVLQFHMQTLPTGVDVDNIWEEWKQRLNTALDEVATRVTKVDSLKCRHCPWTTKELLNLIHKQKSLHRRIVKSAHKNSQLIARHRALRNKTSNLYCRLRNSYFKDRLSLYRTSPRQLWTTIKYVTNKQRLPLQVPVPLNDLSRYFERLLQQPGEYITLPYGPNNTNSLQTFVPVTPTEIEGLLSQLNPRKSPGPNMISPFELKMVKQHISTQLSIIFNESLATGILPAEFKTGNTSSILKPGMRDNSAPNSYRGISLTCVLPKVLEKLYTNNWKHISTRLEHTMRTSMVKGVHVPISYLQQLMTG